MNPQERAYLMGICFFFSFEVLAEQFNSMRLNLVKRDGSKDNSASGSSKPLASMAIETRVV